MRSYWLPIPFLALVAPVLAATDAPPPVELLAALDSGQLSAEFHGAGDRMVTGTISRAEDGPQQAVIAPGTQFWAQLGGRQGQTNLGAVPIDLRDRMVATVSFPTCCTNLLLRAPTPQDIMIPVVCPDARLAALLGKAGITQVPHMAVQAAVWAIANDARAYDVRWVLLHEKAAGATHVQRSQWADAMVAQAGELLRSIGLEPANFRLFR